MTARTFTAVSEHGWKLMENRAVCNADDVSVSPVSAGMVCLAARPKATYKFAELYNRAGLLPS